MDNDENRSVREQDVDQYQLGQRSRFAWSDDLHSRRIQDTSLLDTDAGWYMVSNGTADSCICSIVVFRLNWNWKHRRIWKGSVGFHLYADNFSDHRDCLMNVGRDGWMMLCLVSVICLAFFPFDLDTWLTVISRNGGCLSSTYSRNRTDVWSDEVQLCLHRGVTNKEHYGTKLRT